MVAWSRVGPCLRHCGTRIVGMSLLPHISGLVLPLALGLWCAEETAMTASGTGSRSAQCCCSSAHTSSRSDSALCMSARHSPPRSVGAGAYFVVGLGLLVTLAWTALLDLLGYCAAS